jgi:WD40 repeat protein
MSARIFLSYARSDGSAAAESLIQLLVANNHSASQNLRDLGPDETVWPQIEKASVDGCRIVSGGDDHKLRIWDAASGTPLGEPLRGHEGGVMSVAFSPDDSRIVSGGVDGTLRLWDANTGHLNSTFSFDVSLLAVAVFITHVAVGDALGNVHILRWRTHQ